MSFYNTINLKNTRLKEAKKNERVQKDIVKDIFLLLPQVGYTPYQILDAWPKGVRKPPITSIRRTLTNLVNEDNFLEKLERKVVEREGSPNHLWRLKIPEFKSKNRQLEISI